MFAIAVTWFITGLNYLGIKKAADFQLVFTALKVVLILIVAGLCFAAASGSLSNFTTTLPHAVGGLTGFMAALIATLWAYDGWNDLTMVAGEVRHPERSLPIALIGGLFIVGFLFMATNAAIQYILPAAQIAASERPAVAALTVIAGPAGAGFVAAAMALSIFVTLNGTIMSGARIPYAAARDRLFFRQFAHIHPTLAVAFHVAHRPGAHLYGAAAVPQPLSAVLRAGRVCRVALLHAHRDHRLRLSPQPA
jgi:APA family basic amino acid/polyamine antiporter